MQRVGVVLCPQRGSGVGGRGGVQYDGCKSGRFLFWSKGEVEEGRLRGREEELRWFCVRKKAAGVQGERQ